MHPLEVPAQQLLWASKDTAHNLGFIPEDKLDWKPAPTANSALEIVNHVVYFIRAMIPVVGGAEWQQQVDMTPATTLKEAQDLLTSSAEEYAAALRAVPPGDLRRTINLPFGSFPLARAAMMPAVDLIHHHGQISYIQSLLGDTDMHFHEEGQ